MSQQGLNYLAPFSRSFNPHSEPLLRPHRKLKEVHKRLNELRELVQYYEQTSDMMVDAVNENVKEDEEEVEDEEEEEGTEDGSMFEAMFDSEQENRHSVTNIRCLSFPRLKLLPFAPVTVGSLKSFFAFGLYRNLHLSGNWADLNSGSNRRSTRVTAATTNNRNGRLNTEREINNRSAANLRSLNIPSAIGAAPRPTTFKCFDR